MKKIVCVCTLACLLALLGAYCFERWINPETAFFLRAAEASDAWAMQTAERYPKQKRYIFVGGSDVRSGINPEIFMQDFGMVAINAGGMAAYQLPAVCSASEVYMREGDVLVVGCLNRKNYYLPDMHGMKFAYLRAGNDIFRFGLFPHAFSNYVSLLCGESGPLCMYLSKKVARPDQMFKYDKDTVIHPNGWMDIRYREMNDAVAEPIPDNVKSLSQLAPCAKKYGPFIRSLKLSCQEKGVRPIFFFPMCFQDESYRVAYAWIALCIIREGGHVLKDERLGCDADCMHFADYMLHPTAEGTAIQSRLLAQLLHTETYWTEEDLIAYLRERGWDENGARILAHENR